MNIAFRFSENEYSKNNVKRGVAKSVSANLNALIVLLPLLDLYKAWVDIRESILFKFQYKNWKVINYKWFHHSSQ